MSELIEIKVVSPKSCKVSVPKKLLEDLNRLVSNDKLSEFITEAFRAELKKIRFRKDMAKSSQKVF
ncbi:MAG TPA: hypothetical protein VGB26_04825 [Nitrospiria bacterium]